MGMLIRGPQMSRGKLVSPAPGDGVADAQDQRNKAAKGYAERASLHGGNCAS